MRKRKFSPISLFRLAVFALFFTTLWFFSFDPGVASDYGVGAVEMEVVLLQCVSLLLLMGAFQLPKKITPGWRPALLTLSFIALSESSLVALLTPVS